MELSAKLITDLHRQVITQTVIINALCDILVDSNIISQEDLVNKINSDIKSAEKLISKISKNAKKSKKSKKSNTDEEDFIYDFLVDYDGPIGEA